MKIIRSARTPTLYVSRGLRRADVNKLQLAEFNYNRLLKQKIQIELTGTEHRFATSFLQSQKTNLKMARADTKLKRQSWKGARSPLLQLLVLLGVGLQLVLA